MRLGGIVEGIQLCNSGSDAGHFKFFTVTNVMSGCVTCAACAAIVSRPPKLSPTAGAVRRDAAAQELHVLHEGVVARCRSPAVQCRTGALRPVITDQNRSVTGSGTVPEHGKHSPAEWHQSRDECSIHLINTHLTSHHLRPPHVTLIPS